MKKFYPYPTIFFTFLFFAINSNAQQGLASNQNPCYQESRAKYMAGSDSMTLWHSTTSQETYTAIDYMADLRAERARRREFHRQVHLARIRGRHGWYNNDYGYYPTNGDGYYNNYGYNSSYYRPYYRYNPFWLPVTLGLNFNIR